MKAYCKLNVLFGDVSDDARVKVDMSTGWGL